jgi:TonB-dependent SusC/RagA subfamily outer membrane receptor
MPFVFIYLIRLTIAIALFYGLYRLLLRQLTFYRWNRYYLAGYGAISLVLPFLNFDFLFHTSDSNQLITSIPSINEVSLAQFSSATPERDWLSENYAIVLILLFSAGVLFMIFRMFRQYRSLASIKQKAVLVDRNAAELYDVEADISPFSFNNAIYFNSRKHEPEELAKILQHEFVHVHQKHTIDLMIMEILCIINWFNPFAWMMRKAVRENLEFIADQQVLKTGVDAREYQYLLLKVTGLIQPGLSHHFNISSLKKRIKMMNKMKSAKVHLIKFLFVLPLLCLVLISFRDDASDTKPVVVNDAGMLSLSEIAASVSASDTVPPPPPPPAPPRPPLKEKKQLKEVRIEHELPANVESIQVSQKISVKLKDGKVETFDMSVPDDVKAYRSKYNTLPPPPPIPMRSTPGKKGTTTIQLTQPGGNLPPATASFSLDKTPAVNPLIIIDGVQFPPGTDMNSVIDPDRMQSVNVLKDASATAAYGPAGAAGVISITTDLDAAGVARLKEAAAKKTAVGIRIKKDASAGKFSTDVENFDGKFYLNGKEVSKAEIMKLDPATIIGIDIIKEAKTDGTGQNKTSAGTMKITTVQ